MTLTATATDDMTTDEKHDGFNDGVHDDHRNADGAHHDYCDEAYDGNKGPIKEWSLRGKPLFPPATCHVR